MGVEHDFPALAQGRPAMILPTEAAAVLLPFATAFTAPTYDRFLLLALSALLTSGRRTVANLLRTLGALAPGHRTSYQRVLSSARWATAPRTPTTPSTVRRRRPTPCSASRR